MRVSSRVLRLNILLQVVCQPWRTRAITLCDPALFEKHLASAMRGGMALRAQQASEESHRGSTSDGNVAKATSVRQKCHLAGSCCHCGGTLLLLLSRNREKEEYGMVCPAQASERV